ncbi:MAG: methionine biosynthesis protein MetW [bacterium]
MSDLTAPPTERPDWKAIVNFIPAGTRVLDLGCGDGQFLSLLLAQKDAHGKGVEKDEEKVRYCRARGLSVERGDIEEGLSDFADRSFEFVILNQVLDKPQLPISVLKEMLRVARFGIVSFREAGYLISFRSVLSRLGYYVDRSIFLKGSRQVYFWPKRRAQTAIYVIGGHGTHA